jgi:putative ABC transport system permease protein
LPDFLFFLLISVMVTLLLALLIIAGIWYPARQASRINPVDALHYE